MPTRRQKQSKTPPPPSGPAGINPRKLVAQFLAFMRDRMSLDDDKADPEETSHYIRKGVDFKGTNVWILVFAILVASVGLNVNSTAVVIGAMLISPLMGPIMGIGFGAGVLDFNLIKTSAKNLGLMVGISVVTSTLYFLISPLSDAQSELLSRTHTYHLGCAHRAFWWFGGHCCRVAKRKKQRHSWCGHRHGAHASTLHGRIWSGHGSMVVFLWRFLSLYDQLRFHQFLHAHHRSLLKISAASVSGPSQGQSAPNSG